MSFVVEMVSCVIRSFENAGLENFGDRVFYLLENFVKCGTVTEFAFAEMR